jgi:hypothetical protein
MDSSPTSSAPPSDIAAEAEALSLPTTAVVTDLTEAGRLLAVATDRVKAAEAELDAAKSERKRLAHDVLPALFDSANADRIGLPDAGLDVVIRPYYHANIGGDMDPEQKERAFDHVEELGGGDLIATVVEIKLGRGQLKSAEEIRSALLSAPILSRQDVGTLSRAVMENKLSNHQRAILLQILDSCVHVPDGGLVRLSRGIPWATLTSFLREWFDRRDAALEECAEGQSPAAPFDKVPNLDLLGATIGRVAKIEVRPKRKTRR